MTRARKRAGRGGGGGGTKEKRKEFSYFFLLKMVPGARKRFRGRCHQPSGPRYELN